MPHSWLTYSECTNVRSVGVLFNFRPYLGNIFLVMLQTVLTLERWFLQNIKNDSRYCIMYNCRFLFTSIQRRTSLYYQFCHSVKNRDRVYCTVYNCTCCRTDDAHFSFTYCCAQIQKIELPGKKNKKKQTRQFLPSIHYYFFVLIFSTFFLLRVRFA